jgi:putative hydrolase of the HAD superfamily
MMASARFPTVLFDWGDTVMKDDPGSTDPMVEWAIVEAVPGIVDMLDYLQSSGRRIMLATSANISNESQIHAALTRVDLDRYFSRIYCFKNTGLPKGEAFYRHILNDLGVDVSSTLMVGDTFEKDVLAANQAGIFAVWFNPRSDENRAAELHVTVHAMQELISFFESLDQK